MEQVTNNNDVKKQKSIAGLRANVVAFLVNLSFFSPLAVIFSILALILEPNNEFVRKYAKQTLSLSVLLYVSVVINVVFVIGTFIFGIIALTLAVFQIIAIVYSALGKEFNIPKIDKIIDLLFID